LMCTSAYSSSSGKRFTDVHRTGRNRVHVLRFFGLRLKPLDRSTTEPHDITTTTTVANVQPRLLLIMAAISDTPMCNHHRFWPMCNHHRKRHANVQPRLW
jgi:hypothetical protein